MTILITDDGHPVEVRGSKKSWGISCISDDLGVIISNNRRGDFVYASREVNDGRDDRGRLPISATAPPSHGHRSVDSLCVVRYAITNSAKILDVTEHLVRAGVWVESGDALMLDTLQPEGIFWLCIADSNWGNIHRLRLDGRNRRW